MDVRATILTPDEAGDAGSLCGARAGVCTYDRPAPAYRLVRTDARYVRMVRTHADRSTARMHVWGMLSFAIVVASSSACVDRW